MILDSFIAAKRSAGAKCQRGLRLSCLVFCMTWAPQAAWAEANTPDAERAEELFQAGRLAMSEGRYSVACSDFAQSQHLEPAAGTLVNLAVCFEAQGKTASAWGAYRAVLSLSLQTADADRERVARARLDALGPALCRLVLDLPAAPPEGLEVRLDGASMAASVLEAPIPADPGTHRIDVSVRGRRSWSQLISLVAPGSTLVVPVPELAPDVAPSRLESKSPRRTRVAPNEAARPSALPWGLFISGGVGVVALLTTAYAGSRAAADWSQRQSHCPAQRCDAEAVDASNRAARWARGADVAGAVTLAAAGASLYFALSGSPRIKPPSAVLGVRAGRGGMHLQLASEF
jgi:hypothetical protein